MSATLAPYGFRPIGHSAAGTPVRDVWAMPGGISAAYASTMYENQPVLLSSSGVLNPLTGGTTDFIGIFAGVQYIATAGQTPMWSNWWTASTSFVDGSLIAYITRDPNILFRCQCDGSLAITSIGDQADISNATSGSTGTGMSAATLSSTLVGAGVQGQFRIEGLWPSPTNAWGDAYTEVIVSIARSQYVANKLAI